MTRVLMLAVLGMLPLPSFGQTYEDAVRFLFCGDASEGECIWDVEAKESCVLDIGAVGTQVKYRLFMDKVIWSSSTVDFLGNEFKAACRGECRQPIESGTQDEFERFVLDFFIADEVTISVQTTPDRFNRALEVVVASCPGVTSPF